MSELKIDTNQINSIGPLLRSINDNIDRDFQEVNSRMSSLNNGWTSNIKDSVIGKYKYISNSYVTNRYRIFDDRIKVLTGVVAPSYDITESINAALAKSFK